MGSVGTFPEESVSMILAMGLSEGGTLYKGGKVLAFLSAPVSIRNLHRPGLCFVRQTYDRSQIRGIFEYSLVT